MILNSCVMKTLLLLMVAAISVGLSAQDPITSKNYLVYNTKTEKLCTLEDVISDMANYDVMFFGEEHNDSVAHYLEAKLLEMLKAKYPGKTALSMEMFDRDVQVVMDEYLSGAISEKNFRKDARIWSNYSNYEPMVKFAKENNLDVVCANAAGRYSSMAVMKGMNALKALPPASKLNFAPLPFDTASGAYYQKLMEVFNEMHGSSKSNNAPGFALSFDLILGQSLWDATMAWSIHQYLKKHKGYKVMQVNGKFHSDEKMGIVIQLKKYNKKLRPLVLSVAPHESFPSVDIHSMKHMGDYIIITDPAVPRTFEE